MTKSTPARSGQSRRTSSDQGSRLWNWGIGAGAAAGAAGLAAFNAGRARRAEAANPPVGKFVEVDGVDHHYLDRGSGPVVLLLHGNGTMIEDWLASGVVDRLAGSHRVIAFDRPGFGHSPRPRNAVWTPTAQARLIGAALASLGVTEATVVGHSFGAMVAVALGLDQPALARALVLIGGYYYPSARFDALFASPPAVPIVGDAIRYTVSPLLGSALRHRLERKIFAPAPVASGWSRDFPFEMTLRPSQIRAAAADAAIMVPAAAAMKPEGLAMPVTIVAGAGDEVIAPAEQSGRLSEALSESRLILVKGAGHMVHHSATDEVVAAIAAAVAGRAKLNTQ